MNWIKIILAAGRSSRMGFPKALATVEGVPLISQQVKVGYRAGAETVVVVTGYHECRIRRTLGAMDNDVEFVRNPDPSGDQTSSMKRALESVGTDRGAVMALVDHPVVSPEPIRAVIPMEPTSSCHVRVPSYDARRGHPPFFSPAFLERIDGMDRDQGINRLYREDDVTVEDVPVETSTVLVDLDSPRDLFKFRNVTQ